jgi:hypothetical protein
VAFWVIGPGVVKAQNRVVDSCVAVPVGDHREESVNGGVQRLVVT